MGIDPTSRAVTLDVPVAIIDAIACDLIRVAFGVRSLANYGRSCQAMILVWNFASCLCRKR